MAEHHVWGKYLKSAGKGSAKIVSQSNASFVYLKSALSSIVANLGPDYSIVEAPNDGVHTGFYFSYPWNSGGSAVEYSNITGPNGQSNSAKYVIPLDDGAFFYNNRVYSKHLLVRLDEAGGWTFKISGSYVLVYTNPEGKERVTYGNPNITYEASDYVEDVSRAGSTAFPQDGVSGNFYYIYKGFDSIDPLDIHYSKSELEEGDSVTISITPGTPTYGGTIYYQYKCCTDGRTWVNIGGKTTATSVDVTIPDGAVQFQARAEASDSLGFTSNYFVIGPNIEVSRLKAYVGVNGKARAVKKIYIGIGGKAREVVKGYVGVDGKARKFL